MAKWRSPNGDLQFTMSDTKPILDEMAKLNEKDQRKAADKAAREGMTIVKNAAIANAKSIDRKSTPQTIYKNIVIQRSARQSKRVGGTVMRVGVKGGARQYADTKENRRKGRSGKTYKTLGDASNPGGDTWYWRFLEFGTAHSRARPFLEKALSQNVQQVTDVTVSQMKLELDKLFKVKR